MRKHIDITGIMIPENKTMANQNLDTLIDTVRRLTADGKTNTVEVGQYKSGRYFAKATINEKFMFTCGLELLDFDYGCQIARSGTNGWNKEDMVRNQRFEKLMNYLDSYVRAATSAAPCLKKPVA